MIHRLNKRQYHRLWDKHKLEVFADDATSRIQVWNEIYSNLTRLSYYESDSLTNPGWWGSIEGEEKDINWFLSSL
jgi:hypothetical protein